MKVKERGDGGRDVNVIALTEAIAAAGGLAIPHKVCWLINNHDCGSKAIWTSMCMCLSLLKVLVIIVMSLFGGGVSNDMGMSLIINYQLLFYCFSELYHTDMVSRAAPPPLGGIHTIGQSSSAVSTNDSSSSHHGDGIGGVTGFTASQLPSTASGKSNKGNEKGGVHCMLR